MMSFRKRNSKVVVHNHINEIDYDKLAEAIVKANTPKEEIKPTEKTGFWKAVWKTIFNKEAKSGKKTAYLLAEIMVSIFNTMAILSVLTAVGTVIVSAQQLDWTMSIGPIIVQAFIVAIFVVIILATALIFRAIANEIGAEKDRNYITTLFFGFISLASLIVALIALFKGVG